MNNFKKIIVRNVLFPQSRKTDFLLPHLLKEIKYNDVIICITII
jgi:hypothetical protein